MFPKVVWRKRLRSFDTSNIMTFCQIFEIASHVRQKVVDHRSLTIEKRSVQEKKVVGDKRSLMAGSLMTGSTVEAYHFFVSSHSIHLLTEGPLRLWWLSLYYDGINIADVYNTAKTRRGTCLALRFQTGSWMLFIDTRNLGLPYLGYFMTCSDNWRFHWPLY